MSRNTEIHLAIAFDENYVDLSYILLTSIFENNKNVKLIIHSIATGVTKESKEQIKTFVHQKGNEIFFYTINEETLNKVAIVKNSHLTNAAYYRLFFPDIIPASIKKVLYLDMDIIVIGGLEKLYNTELGSNILGAVVDTNTVTCPHLEIFETHNYFNSGVMLINTEEWRKQGITQKAFDFMKAYPEKIKFEDQDALNGVLVNKWLKLEQKYNVTIFDIPENLKKSEYKSFLKDKVVIHYTKGKHKPWLILNKNRFRFLYRFYLKISPVRLKKQYVDFTLKPIILYRLFKIRVAENIAGYPGIYELAKKAKFV